MLCWVGASRIKIIIFKTFELLTESIKNSVQNMIIDVCAVINKIVEVNRMKYLYTYFFTNLVSLLLQVSLMRNHIEKQQSSLERIQMCYRKFV